MRYQLIGRFAIGRFALSQNALHLNAGMPAARKSAFETPYVEIIDRLIARRKELGMSQADFAKAYGEDQPFVSRIERRQRRLDVWEFVRFCQILKVEPGDLLRGVGD